VAWSRTSVASRWPRSSAQITSELGLELEDIAQANLEKLLSRQRRGVLSGSGDER
jgi:hypothetical protein